MTVASPYCPSRRTSAISGRESEVLQISRDGSECRGQFTAIVAIAFARISADPLARVHLKRGGARADHLPRLRPGSPGAQTASSRRRAAGKVGLHGQRPLPCGLTRRIDVKNQVAAPLSIEDAANGFRCPALGERLLLEERAEGFQTRTIDIGQKRLKLER